MVGNSAPSVATHRRARSDPVPQLGGRAPHASPSVAAVSPSAGSAFVNIDEEDSVGGMMEMDENAHARAQERWGMVIQAVKRMVKTTAMFRLMHYDYFADEPGKIKLPKIETFANYKIHMLLTKAHISHNPDDYLLLDRAISRALPCIQRFTYDQRKQMYAASMTYEVHSKSTIMMKDGYTAESVYFILSGSVEVYKDHRGVRLKQNLIKEGEMFGELQAFHLLKEGGTTRGANVVCVGHCEFLRLDIDDYIRILFGHDGSEVDVRVVLLNSLPMFNETHEVNLQKAAQNSIVKTFMPGDRIFLESDPSSYIYFICKGMIRMTRTVRFLRTYLVPGEFGVGNQVVAPWNEEDSRAPRIGEEIFGREMFVCDVGVGMTFPELVLPKGLAINPGRERKADFLPRGVGIGDGHKGGAGGTTVRGAGASGAGGHGAGGRRGSKMHQLAGPTLTEEDRNAQPCMLNAYAITFTECVVFPISAFLQAATNEMVSQVLTNNDIFRVSIPFLQETYIKWIVRNGQDPEDLSVEIGAPPCGVTIGGAAARQALQMKRPPPPTQAHSTPSVASALSSAAASHSVEESETSLSSSSANAPNNPHPPASAAAAAILGRLHKQHKHSGHNGMRRIDSEMSDLSSDDESALI
ncbi:hypothetical protein HDV00_000534 [Rhizophlyctis rosea]|nr:hypothetical protein HDV00_000534 [Rhizophlyctis rosea]